MKHNNYDWCKSSIPYPEIRVMGQNKYYASLLKEDYTGFVSEMTAINQYIYHSFVIRPYDKQLSEMLMCIAIVEMHHLDILAHLIVLLGENPTYYIEPNFWSGSYVDYGYNLLEQLESDLKAEYEAIANYQKHIMMIHDPYIQNILRRIVIDEEMHVNLFKEAIARVKQNIK